MDFFSFLCFIELAKELNFTRAAANLFVSQQCLSQHIKKLEDHYGVALFERKPRVRLTFAGSLLLDAASQILKIDNQLKAQLSYVTKNQFGTVKVGITPARVQGFLPLIVPPFHKLYPNVSLTLVEAHTAELERKLLKGEVDVILASRFNDPRLDNPLFTYTELMCERLFLVVSDELLMRHYPQLSGRELAQTGAHMRQLMELPLIMSPSTSRVQASVEQLFFKENRRPVQRIVSNRGSSMLSLCRQGFCAALLLEMILFTATAETPAMLKDLHIIPLLDESLTNTVALIHRSDEVLPQYLKTFMHLTQELFAPHFSLSRLIDQRGDTRP